MSENSSISLDATTLRSAAERYDATERSELERHLFESLGPNVRDRGHLTKDDLDALARWRAQRASGFVARNDPDEVVEISRLAFAAGTSDRVRLKLLTLLDGVSDRTAATALAIWDPDRYVPWDERTARVLTAAARIDDASLPANWTQYLSSVALLADDAGLSLRGAEKALFAMGTDLTGAQPTGHQSLEKTATSKPRRGPSITPEARGDIDDEAGRELMRQIRAHADESRDIEEIVTKAERVLELTTPEQRRLLLRLHRRLTGMGLYTKTSRDLGWWYYANDIGKGLAGEIALRVPRGVREIRLVAYIPVEVSSGRNSVHFETTSQTQQKGLIPTDALAEDDLIASFEKAQHLMYLRR